MASQIIASGIFQENYRFLQQYVYSRVGIVLEDNKHYLFESRLAPIVKELGLASVNDLCVFLHKEHNAKVAQQVDEAMTTNETYFFRDPRQYEAIRTVLLPKLRQEPRASNRGLRFWSAASSTGQEAYSLAMLLLEEGLVDQRIEILGTDFCSKVVERARSGIYQQIEVNRGLPTSLLVKYFERSGLEWKLSERVRQMARFERIDLRNRMNALGPFDLVFCRNVMIYFDEETKRKVMKEIHGTLSRGGWLILGGTETASGLDEWYERQIIGNITVYIAR
jgi:chemotaxis protein methyltransferase CheR